MNISTGGTGLRIGNQAQPSRNQNLDDRNWARLSGLTSNQLEKLIIMMGIPRRDLPVTGDSELPGAIWRQCAGNPSKLNASLNRV